MIIRGNTVGCAAPRADYAQDDPTKADYIKNKPDEAIRKAQEAADLAQETADQAQETADLALPKTGGDMTGEIRMNGNPVSGLDTPTEDTQAANKAYVDAAKAEANAYTDGRRLTQTATITTTWSGSAAPYTQSVSVSGILASDMPHIMPVYSTTNATAIAQKEAWACVSKAVTAAGKIIFTCFEDKPTTAIPIQIEVIR